MKAMVLAAGLGTRLRPLTSDRPKALVEVAGRTLLDLTLARLRTFGIHDVIINTHHFADLIVDYLRVHDNFGMRIAISHESVLLDTGGGIKKAAPFLCDSDPFLIHNVDVVSNIDFTRMLRFHNDRRPLATLAVQSRSTSRFLLFDQNDQLCGRRTGPNGPPELVLPAAETKELAFCGIHFLSPRIFSAMHEEGIFSVIPTYLRLAGQHGAVLGYRADHYYWRDLGRPEQIARVALEIQDGTYRG